jgi:hypothetical protein
MSFDLSNGNKSSISPSTGQSDSMKDSIQFSLFQNTGDKMPTVLTLGEFISAIRNGRWQQEIDRHRSIPEPKGRQANKRSLPCITPGAVCENGHKAEHIKAYSFILQADFDLKPGKANDRFADADAVDDVVADLSQDPYTLFVFRP